MGKGDDVGVWWVVGDIGELRVRAHGSRRHGKIEIAD